MIKYTKYGFSLIELITVILLLGILSIVALGRFADQDAFAARGFFDDTVVAVRFAQKLAISTGCDVRVVTSMTRYDVLRSTSCTLDDFAVPVLNPANRSNNYLNNNMPSGFSLTPGIITFNAQGLREEATSTFSVSGGTTLFRFRVHATTGLVEVI